MCKLDLTSNITFLYFNDLAKAKIFFADTLGLEAVFDPGWSCVYRLGVTSFLGAVDHASGSIEVEARGGVLISLTVRNIEEVYAHLKVCGVQDLSEIKMVKDIALKSFFFTGPEGYKFEVEQFTSGALKELF